MSKFFELFQKWEVPLETYPWLDSLIVAFALFVLTFAVDLLCRRVILRLILKLVNRTKAQWDDVLFNEKVLQPISHLVAPLIAYVLIPICFVEMNEVWTFFQRFCLAWIVGLFVHFIALFLSAIYQVNKDKEAFRDKPLLGIVQTLQGIIYGVGIIILISILFQKSPMVLLTGLGASAAVLMLIFKDSIMGFVSGIQLSANDMLKVGDWITMPKYGADGSVIEVTLNTVKVRNFDNTIITLPPYVLVSDSFQNWRGMQDSGGRRVKRSLFLDMSSVKFCTPKMLERFCKITLLEDYVRKTEKKVNDFNSSHQVDETNQVNGIHQTNIGVFRAYLDLYLRSLPTVNQNMTILVRLLQPTEKGVPIELYFFTKTTDWLLYEKIQSDVFDHVLAILPEFDLQVFQSPSGKDLHGFITRSINR